MGFFDNFFHKFIVFQSSFSKFCRKLVTSGNCRQSSTEEISMFGTLSKIAVMLSQICSHLNFLSGIDSVHLWAFFQSLLLPKAKVHSSFNTFGTSFSDSLLIAFYITKSKVFNTNIRVGQNRLAGWLIWDISAGQLAGWLIL